MTRHHLLLSTISMALLSIAAASAGTASELPGYDARLILEKHLFSGGSERRVRGQWGTLEVPENWNDALSRRIQLPFGRLPARGAGAAVPTFFIAGGPGASGLGSIAANGKLLMPLRDFGDVIIVEQRGTGFSRPRLDCAEHWNLSLEAPLERSRLIGVARDRFAACRREWEREGVDLAGYNTVAFARDIVAVADALGHARFRVVAFSYGTQIAWELLRAHPERLVGAALLGVMGPADALRDPRDHDEILRRAAALLERDEAAAHYPGLLALTELGIARLRVEPITVTLPGTGGEPPSEFVFDEFAFRRQMVVRLGMREELAILPRFITALLSGGDEAWLEAELRRRLSGLRAMRQGPIAWRSAAQHYSTVCAGADPTPRNDAPPGSVLGHTFHLALPEACDAWGVPSLGTAFRRPHRSDVPVLMISGDLDTRTPMAQAERLLPFLSNADHVVMRNAGHDDVLEVCDPALERIVAFFGGRPVDTTEIVLPPVRFDLPVTTTADCETRPCRRDTTTAGHAARAAPVRRP